MYSKVIQLYTYIHSCFIFFSWCLSQEIGYVNSSLWYTVGLGCLSILKLSSLHLLTPNSQSSPLLPPPLANRKSILYVETISFSSLFFKVKNPGPEWGKILVHFLIVTNSISWFHPLNLGHFIFILFFTLLCLGGMCICIHFEKPKKNIHRHFQCPKNCISWG